MALIASADALIAVGTRSILIEREPKMTDREMQEKRYEKQAILRYAEPSETTSGALSNSAIRHGAAMYVPATKIAAVMAPVI